MTTTTYDLTIKLVQNSTRLSRAITLQFEPEDLLKINPCWYTDLIETMKKQIVEQANEIEAKNPGVYPGFSLVE